jgi:AraC-like DNA-binding protein
MAVFINKELFDTHLAKYSLEIKTVFSGNFYDLGSNVLLLLKEFMVEASYQIQGRDSTLQALSVAICHSIIRSVFKIGPRISQHSFRVEIERAINYIHTNLSRKITLKELANVAHMSPTHLTRVFKKEVGISFTDYKNKIRLKMAKKFLLAGDKTITDIADECGFGSLSYFYACFHKNFKISPARYKNDFKKEKNRKIKEDLILLNIG